MQGFGMKETFTLGYFPLSRSRDPHPEMPCKGLCQRDGWIIVSVMFVTARQKAVVAAGALLQIDDHSVVAHSSPVLWDNPFKDYP